MQVGKQSRKELIEMPKVLIVGPASPSTGGIPSYIDDLLLSGLRKKFKMRLLDPLMVKKRFKKQESHVSPKEIVASMRVLTAFVKNIRRYRPALVHIHTSSYWGFYEKAILMLVTRYLFKKKAILHIHGGRFDQFYNGAICKNLIRWIIWQADKTLIVSKSIKETLRLSNAIHVDNCTRFEKSLFSGNKVALKKKYGVPHNKKVFLSATLLQKEKGIYETLKAFNSIHKRRGDFYLIIAGEGPEEGSLMNYVKTKDLVRNVKIMDYISGQVKDDIFHLSDCFILNSVVESFGISLIEAVSHGLFVITTPVGIASEAENVFYEGNCILVPIKNTKALENAILSVLDKKIDIVRIREKNFNDFKARFDIEPVFEKMELIYEEMLTSN